MFEFLIRSTKRVIPSVGTLLSGVRLISNRQNLRGCEKLWATPYLGVFLWTNLSVRRLLKTR